MANLTKHRDIKILTTEKRNRKLLQIKKNYQVFRRKFVGYRNEKNSITFEYAFLCPFINIRFDYTVIVIIGMNI